MQGSRGVRTTTQPQPARTFSFCETIAENLKRSPIVRIDRIFVGMIFHLQGGDHTALKLEMNMVG
jgi:hypothetical protein